MNQIANLSTQGARDAPDLVGRLLEILGLSLKLACVDFWQVLPPPDGGQAVCKKSYSAGGAPREPTAIGPGRLLEVQRSLSANPSVIAPPLGGARSTPPTAPNAFYAAVRGANLTGFLYAERAGEEAEWPTAYRASLTAAASILPYLIRVQPQEQEQEQLEHAVSLLTATLESTAEGIVAVGMDQRITLVNQRFREMFGLENVAEHPMIGTRIRDNILHLLENPDQVVRDVDTLYLEPEMQGVHLLTAKDGRAYERFSKPQKAEGRIVGRIFSYRDVTERVRSEQLQAKLQQAHKLEAIGKLASGIAHDFNNVLSAITCDTMIAQSELPPGHPAAESINNIKAAARYAADLLQQILTFGSHQVLERKLQAIPPLVGEVLDLLRPTLPKTITVRTDFANDLADIRVGTIPLKQVLMNLCANAAQAIGGNPGCIELRARNLIVSEDTVKEVPGLKPGPHVLISVSDTGCGMDAATAERIFEPFFTTKPKGQGVGLGLAVVYGIVRAHNGAITVSSQPGKGTLFQLYLPLPEAEAAFQQEKKT